MTEENKLQPAMSYVKRDDLQPAMTHIKAEEKKISPEDKVYIVLYYADIDDEEVKSFEVLKGRTATYNFIKNIIEYTDIHESKVVIDDVPYDESLSIYEFMIVMKNYFHDAFDIEDYNVGDK